MQADCLEVFHINSPTLLRARRAVSPVIVHLCVMWAHRRVAGEDADDFLDFAEARYLIQHDERLRSN